MIQSIAAVNTIMGNETQDELLSGQGVSVAQPEVLPNQKPRRFFDIPIDVVDTVSQYMNIVLQRSSTASHKNVDVKSVIINAQNMFRNGVKYNDSLWFQHTAASVRELLVFIRIDNEDFHTAHSSIPLYSRDQKIKEPLDRLILICSYLSDIVHFVPGNRLGILHKLYPSFGYGSLDKDKFFREEADDESHFEKVCIDLIYILNDIFHTYCVGGPSETTGV